MPHISKLSSGLNEWMERRFQTDKNKTKSEIDGSPADYTPTPPIHHLLKCACPARGQCRQRLHKGRRPPEKSAAAKVRRENLIFNSRQGSSLKAP
jgi:hypothetical protein